MLIAIKKIAPALAAGNSVVVKPSELAPVTLLDFAALCKEAGLPDGVLNVLPGLGAEAGRALTEHRGVKKLDLTGGTATGAAPRGPRRPARRGERSRFPSCARLRPGGGCQCGAQPSLRDRRAGRQGAHAGVPGRGYRPGA